MFLTQALCCMVYRHIQRNRSFTVETKNLAIGFQIINRYPRTRIIVGNY